MDLSIRPWLVKLILLGGLIARPMEAQADPALAADSANQRVWRLQRAREDAVDHWSALEQRDSAINLLRRTVDPLVVSFSGFSPATDWKTMESAIRRSVGSPASIQPNVRLGVLVYNGRRYSPDKPTQGWRGYTGTHLAQEGPALLCVTLISAGEEQIAAEHRSVYSGGDWEHYLAPCLWYARFGRPGPKISAWLASTRFSAGLDLRGLGTEPDTARRASEIPWRTSYWFGDWGQLGFFGRLNIVASTLYGLHRPPRYGVGRHALLCAQGSKVDCAFSVLDTASQSRMGKAWPDGFIHEAAYETADEMRGIAANHPVRQSFLGDLLISKGPKDSDVSGSRTLRSNMRFANRLEWNSETTRIAGRVRCGTEVTRTNLAPRSSSSGPTCD